MKLYEFVDRLYAMGDMESPKTIKPKKVLNESLNEDIQINFPEYDYTPEDIKKAALAAINETGIPESEVVAVTYQPDNGYEYDHFYVDFANGDEEDISGQYINDAEDLAYSLAEVFTEYIEDNLAEDEEDDLYEEGLTEAANPENAEVNAVLRKWANSDRNRISKRDQKVLDDAGIKLKTNKYDAPHKYAVHKDNEGDILDPHRMDKHHIKNTHPDHDLANDLATTGRHWSNRDRYNKNKDPRFPWRDDEYRSETPEESDALRPYSDKYKSLKRAVDGSESYPYLHADAEKKLDDFRAKMAARKNESLTEDKDLSTVKGSMTKILQDNREKIDACGSAKEVHDTVAGLLAEAGLDTPATRRLLLTLKKQRGLTGALQAVYNSILKGSDLGVIKEAANTNPPSVQSKGLQQERKSRKS